MEAKKVIGEAKKTAAHIEVDTSEIKDFSREAANAQKNLAEVQKMMAKMDFSDSPPSLPNADKLIESSADAIKKLQDELTILEASADVLSDLQRESYVELSVKLAVGREFDEFIQTLPKGEQQMLELTRKTKTLDEAIQQLASTNKLAAAKMKLAAEAAKENAKASKTYAREVQKAEGVLGLLND